MSAIAIARSTGRTLAGSQRSPCLGDLQRARPIRQRIPPAFCRLPRPRPPCDALSGRGTHAMAVLSPARARSRPSHCRGGSAPGRGSVQDEPVGRHRMVRRCAGVPKPRASGEGPRRRLRSPVAHAGYGRPGRELCLQPDLDMRRDRGPLTLGVVEGDCAAGGLALSTPRTAPLAGTTMTPSSETDALTASAGMSSAARMLASVSGAMLSQRSCMHLGQALQRAHRRRHAAHLREELLRFTRVQWPIIISPSCAAGRVR